MPSDTVEPQPSAIPPSPEPTETPGPRTPQEYQATAIAREAPDVPISEAVRYQQPYRPQYHFSPAQGWLGDPDGMVRFQGLYHLFWWGHADSPDLVHWNERVQPMFGDDGSFVYFSGSVVVDLDNTSGLAVDPAQPPMVAVYTMHNRLTNIETQGLSVSYDYRTFVYYDQNPILVSERQGFRDPQVFFHEPTQRWIMVIAFADERKVGIFASTDLTHWEHLSDFGPIGAQSQVWEVPDLFELPVDGDPGRSKWVLLCGMGPNREQYFIGDFDGTTFTLDPEQNGYLLRGEGLPGELFADFETALPSGWVAEGDPVAIGPGDDLGNTRVSGFIGTGFVSTYTPGSTSGNRGQARLTSPDFSISHGFINFLISGGHDAADAGVYLVVDGDTVRSSTGDGTDVMKWAGWDVTDLIGKTARIEIRDSTTSGDHGRINVDHIRFADTPAQAGREHALWLDYGADYYAVRTYRDYDGAENRVVTMGWLGNWEYAQQVPTSWGKGALALPREITLQSFPGGLRIIQQPIPALTSLRGASVHVNDRTLGDLTPLTEFQPTRNTYELEAEFAITDPQARFGLRLAIGGTAGVSVGYDALTHTVFVDRRDPENGTLIPQFSKYLEAPLEPNDGRVRLRIFVDQSSLEVFAQDGQVSLSALMFPSAESLGIATFSERGTTQLVRLEAWPLESIWGVPAP